MDARVHINGLVAVGPIVGLTRILVSCMVQRTGKERVIGIVITIDRAGCVIVFDPLFLVGCSRLAVVSL